MAGPPPRSAAALQQHRERTIARLCEHFARDQLELEELEARIDRAHRAATAAELDQLLRELPSVAPPHAAADLLAMPARRDDDRDYQLIAAVMGGAERGGSWIPARRTHVVAFMGGACLDFRHAVLPPGLVEVSVLAIMGGVEIRVPPGVHVESSGIGIMGGFQHTGQGRFPVDSSVPVLRITGVALMGGVEILERAPGERVHRDPARELRRRLRENMRELRDDLRGL